MGRKIKLKDPYIWSFSQINLDFDRIENRICIDNEPRLEFVMNTQHCNKIPTANLYNIYQEQDPRLSARP